MAQKLLLLEDVDVLGRKGDLVSVKPGYARNFLVPQGLAIIADTRALRIQERLQEERRKKAAEDKKESEALAQKLTDVEVVAVVKVDHEGHMYGSVSAMDVVHLLLDQHKIQVEKRFVQLPHPIKAVGSHSIKLKLKEGIATAITLKVEAEEGSSEKAEG